uniref:Acetyl-coenzyme A carboxylase carboxyl transferase subunit beta n=1 Tax=Primula calyptrata TaxID=690488 RepID=A0A7L9DB55_9ERIC|nr:acetyl-CoA carboxylase carboxyltransferase beta subunit [Primula calyptrata]QOJ51214.1 acetyl-CoA carboxylase carboxyltransferase beta subunit [Primula calyptrata]
MKKWQFNLMLSNKELELEHRCGLSKSMDSRSPIDKHFNESEDSNRNDRDHHSWSYSKSSTYSNVDHLFGVKAIGNFISDDTFLVRNRNGDSYSIYFDIENTLFEINNDHSFLSEPERPFSSYPNSYYLNNGSNSDDPYSDRSMIEFHSEEEPYKDRIDSYQRKTGLTEAVQTGIGQLNGIPVTIGVMDFQFMGGSMGSVVGEKMTRLIEYAIKKFRPLIIVCASGGARMQEGSLSLMQMAKISSALYDYQSNKKLFYVPIITSPPTGGVTASFGMLGDIIIAEPNAYIAFAGKRVIEQTLNKTVPEGSQVAKYLFQKGLFDLIVPRNLLKSVLSELFQLHAFFPLNQNSKTIHFHSFFVVNT